MHNMQNGNHIDKMQYPWRYPWDGELAEEQQRLKHKAINKKIPNAYEAANMTSSSGGKQNRKDTCEHELVYIYIYIYDAYILCGKCSG